MNYVTNVENCLGIRKKSGSVGHTIIERIQSIIDLSAQFFIANEIARPIHFGQKRTRVQTRRPGTKTRYEDMHTPVSG
jgi:hypothetical protein